jgi:hypothetical protein
MGMTTGLERPYNFSAGPAAMPEEVLRTAAAEMLDWHGSGLGVMEMSHRGKEFGAIAAKAEADLRRLLAVPEHFHILFMQGGGLGENAIVPMNLSRGTAADFVVTGSWSTKSHKEAQRYCQARIAASNAGDHHTRLPDPATWKIGADAAYVHLCTNETIHGVEVHELPDLAALGSDAPLVIDFSSHVASRPVDWRRVGLAFGGALHLLDDLGHAVGSEVGRALAFLDFAHRLGDACALVEQVDQALVERVDLNAQVGQAGGLIGGIGCGRHGGGRSGGCHRSIGPLHRATGAASSIRPVRSRILACSPPAPGRPRSAWRCRCSRACRRPTCGP